MAAEEDQRVKLFMLMNYASSISIVFLNKWAYNHGFPSLTLTFLHFVVSFLGLEMCSRMGIFTVKRLAIRDVMPLSATFCGFVVFTNLSLQYNSVGFYQMAKVMTTPCIVLIQTLFYQETFQRSIVLSLLVICCGVLLATKADMSFNGIGASFATCGVLITSLYQIFVKTKQKDLGVTSFQLLYYQAPLSAAMLGCIVPFVDPIFGDEGILYRTWPVEAMVAVSLSSGMAFVVNLSIFLVIGKTSPVTYNVLGHFKLCTVLLGSFLIFHDSINLIQGIGIAIALFGVIRYTDLKLKAMTLPTTTREL